mgnify:CR=1 FL=1
MNKATSITININTSKITYNSLIESCVALGYTRQPMVLEKGEFSVRGNIIDIYPYNHSHPIRIEYFDNTIDRLNSFNPNTQRSITKIKTTTITKVKKQKIEFTKITADTGNEELLSDLKENCFIVHENYGIGQYVGLERKIFGEREGEYLHIK